MDYAATQDWQVIQEYSDTVILGKTDDRPGFQQLHQDMRHRRREWQAILVLDTSRIARRIYIAEAFRHEAEKQGVDIHYKNLPDIDPITQTIIRSVLQAMDEYHSLISKEKGLAGMRENVMKGYRAGGRAPRGYQLDAVKTGAMRDGSEVMKSKLVPNQEAPQVKRYLQARAEGRSRKALLDEMQLDWPANSVIGMEWNALTYAGHTVWNQHNERGKTGYKGGTKHRPRSEWVVKEHTHEALISTEEAESILIQLENSPHSKGRCPPAKYLLTGLLMTKSGQKYEGNQRSRGGRKDYYYRLRGDKNTHYRCEVIDAVVLKQRLIDLNSGEFAEALLGEVRRVSNETETDPAEDVRSELVVLNNKIDRLMNMTLVLEDPDPAYRQVDPSEKQRKAVKAEVEQLEAQYNAAAQLKQLNLGHIQSMLALFAKDLQELTREQLKDLLFNLLEKVELEPNSVEMRLAYRFQPNTDGWDKVASPRDLADNSHKLSFCFASCKRLYGRRV